MSWFGNHCKISANFILFVSIVLGVALAPHVQADGNYCGCPKIHNELIVKFADAFPESPEHYRQIPLLDSLISTLKLKEIIQLSSLTSFENRDKPQNSIYHFIFTDTLNFQEILPKLNQHKRIDFAEPNYCYWGAGNPVQAQQLFTNASLERLELTKARSWSKARKMQPQKETVIVGIIDAGFEPDFNSNEKQKSDAYPGWLNPKEIINLASRPAESSFESRHGFLLSGLVRHVFAELKPRNKLPLEILPIVAGNPVSEICLRFTATHCAKAIDYAVAQQAKIILMGWSGPYPSKLLKNSIDRAFRQGALIVAAAGNQNQNTPVFPAAWSHVLSVAATDLSDRKSGESNFGEWVDVSAPGNLVKNETHLQSGTSAAAAVTAGLAALIQSAENELSPEILTRRIIYSCDNIDSVNTNFRGLLGAGRVNALRAIKEEFQPNITLRKKKLSIEKKSADSAEYNFSLSLMLENIAADAPSVIVRLADLPENSLVKPEKFEISDFAFRQIHSCEFLLELPEDLAQLKAKLKVTAGNSFYKSIPLALDIPAHISAIPVDSVKTTRDKPEPAANRQFDFAPKVISLLPNPRSALFVLGADSAGKICGTIWNGRQKLESIILTTDSLVNADIFLEDLNLDGLADLGLPTGNGWQIFSNQGDDRFSEKPVATLPTRFPVSGDFFDLDFDGLPDFLTNNPEFTCFRNMGDWNFTAQQSDISIGFRQIGIADLNADGYPDLIGRPNRSEKLRIYRGTDLWFTEDSFTELEIRATQFEIAPLDADFSNDLIVVDSKDDESRLKIYLNQSGNFSEHQNLVLAPFRQMLPGDFDNDRDFDLLILFKNQAPQIFLNDGAANFSAAPFRFGKKRLAFGTLLDFNGDGALDLAGITRTDSLRIFLNQFTNVPSEPPAVPQNLTQEIDSTGILLRWEPAAIREAGGATFELRLWTGDAADSKFSAKFRPGNLGQSNRFKFKPAAGKNYFWTMQAVDAAFRRSDWAPVQQVQRPNRVPKIHDFWPPQDTTLTAGDSLFFQVTVTDADRDSLIFQWQAGKEESTDSTFLFIPGSMADSVSLKISDRDTTIAINWQISVRQSLADSFRYFPAKDTALAVTDSLIFRVDFPETAPEKFQFAWRNSAVSEFLPGENTFHYFPSKDATSETLSVQICHDDSCWYHNWRIRIHRFNSPPEITHLSPVGDSTLVSGDSLGFFCRAIDADDDSLQISWRTSSAQTGTDSIFSYVAPGGRQFRDSVWVTVADADTSIQHVWEITIKRMNLPPHIFAHTPDSLSVSVREGDSLEFKIFVRDPNADSLSFSWLNVDRDAADSTLQVKWDYFSAGFDSLGVRVADPDTAIELWWYFQIQNTNQLPQIEHCFPASDTTLFDCDSLKISLEIFEPDSQPVSISWSRNRNPVEEFENQPFFYFRAPESFPEKDTVLVRVSDGDTTLQKQWIITSRRENHCPRLAHFWPLHDTLLVEGDSLEFRVQGIDEDADSLKYSWRVNQQSAVSFDSLFQFNAIYFPPGIDTVEVRISDGDTLVNHSWLVEIMNINTAPTVPEPLFPLQGEILLESEHLQWCPARDPDPEDQQLTYFVQIASDSLFESICSADSVKADTVFSLRGCGGFHQFESGQTYYWRVQAVDHSRDTSRIFPEWGCFRFQHVSAQILKAYGQNNGEGGITVFWETAHEKGNLGFNLLRKNSPASRFQRINEMLIRGTSPYSYLDSDVDAGETYYYCIECVSVTGMTFRHDLIEISAPVPEAFALHQNYPNPLTLETLIRFQIPRKCHVSLSVYNILGEEVRTLVRETREKGFYDVIWNGRDENGREVGSGIYFYSITAERFHETRKIMVVR